MFVYILSATLTMATVIDINAPTAATVFGARDEFPGAIAPWRDRTRNLIKGGPGPHCTPAPLALCILEPAVLPPPEAPRGVAFLARLHGGTRERRALRASVEKKDARR